MFKIIILFFAMIFISVSAELEYNGLDSTIKKEISDIYLNYKKRLIDNIILSSREYIYYKTYGETLLEEIDKLKIKYNIYTIFDIRGENKNINIIPKISIQGKFLEKGNELNLKLNANYGYDISKKEENINFSFLFDTIFRKTNTKISAIFNYDFDKKYKSHYIFGNLKISNAFAIRNKYIFDINFGYLYNYKIPNEYLSKRDISYKTDNSFFDSSIILGMKFGIKFDKIYPYIGLDAIYNINKDKNIFFEYEHNIKLKKDDENIYFVPNLGIIYNIKENQQVILKINSILSLKKFDRYALEFSYCYGDDFEKH